MMKSMLFTFLILHVSFSLASRVGVIDSNFDFASPYLSPYVLTSQSYNLDDESSNIYSLPNYQPEALEMYEEWATINSKESDEENLSSEEIQRRIRINTMDSVRDMFKQVQSHVHGSHVAGILTKDSDHELVALKWDVGTNLYTYSLTSLQLAIISDESITEEEKIKKVVRSKFSFLSKISKRLRSSRIKVANFSWGMNSSHLEMHFCVIFSICSFSDQRYQIYLNEVKNALTEFFNENHETLFVIAAGNENTDLDKTPNLFALKKYDNVLIVGAINRKAHRAMFSNFGARSVDVYCPGVGIESVAFGKRLLKLSGTSQAAPYAANHAGRILDLRSLSKNDLIQEIVKTSDCRTLPTN